MKRIYLAAMLSVGLFAQRGLDPATLLKVPTGAWPSYNGDYSGRRYSPLTKINASNIKSLGLSWLYRLNTGIGGGGTIKATPLMVNGVLYFTVPDHAWAVDARTGRELWHYRWESKGGIHIGNRGVGIYGNWLYFETPDCHLVSLNIKDGSERWRKVICDLDQMYFGSVAPVVVGNHVIVGVSGDDLDIPGYLESRDPETGDLKWRWYVVPQNPGDPGSETWPNAEAGRHGGGMTWIPGTYDPELKLFYIGTGNPQPVLAGKGRQGDNLFTESIVAIHVETGKMAWYFQPSPHDTHDWDASQTPVLFDGEFGGRRRKLIAQASRNGYFFVLDRATGERLVTSAFVKTNWAKGLNEKGQPMRDPAKDPQPDGVLVSPASGGAANWPAPTFNPETGLFYVNTTRSYSVFYLTDLSDKPQGWGGVDRGGYSENYLTAIDYKTGKVRWSHRWSGTSRSGWLSTAGKLLFGGDGSGHLVAVDPATGNPLWHAGLGANVGNGPITYELDGIQYVVVGAGDTLFAFAMLAP